MARQGKDLWTCAVEDNHGAVVALEVLTLYDGGKTGWLDALRVHPLAQGRGLAFLVQETLVQFARDVLQVKQVRSNTAVQNAASRRLFAKCGLVEHKQWGLAMPAGDIALGDKSQSDGALDAWTSRLATSLPTAGSSPPSLSEYQDSAAGLFGFFKERLELEVILQYWKVYDLTLPAVEALLDSGKHERPWVGRDPGTGEVCSLSWATWVRDGEGLSAFITVYHRSDWECLRAHTLMEIERAREQGARMVMLFYDFECEPELHGCG